jgi:hypothetical protein
MSICHLPSMARFHRSTRRRGGWPLAARVQQGDRVRRIGVLMPPPDAPPIGAPPQFARDAAGQPGQGR